MLNFERSFQSALLPVGALALFLICSSDVLAHAPLKIPVTAVHLGRIAAVNPVHAELNKLLLLRSSNATHLTAAPLLHAAAPVATSHVLSSTAIPTHSDFASVSRIVTAEPVHAAVSNSLLAPNAIDLNFAAYAEAEREKLKSIALLLVQIGRLEQRSASAAEIERYAAKAREHLFSLPKATILQVARDETFVRLNSLKYLFRL